MTPRTLTAGLVMSAVIWFPAIAHAQDGGALSMAHGVYVEADAQCAAAQAANTISYWGDQLNSAHIIGHIRNVVGSDDIYTVTLDLEGNGGMGGDLRDQVEWLVITDEGDALLIDNGIDSTLYMWCAASMDDLDEMRQEQTNAAPVSSADASSWVPMQELRTGMEPSDSRVAWIWQAEMQAQADAIRARDGEYFVGGEPTILPDDGFLPTDFLAAEFETEDAYHVISIMFQRPPACDNGPNTFTSTQIHSECPARLTTIPKDGSEQSTVEQSGACAIWSFSVDQPEPDTGTFARMRGDVIEIEARQGGEPVPDCTISFSLGQTSAAAQPDAVDSGDTNLPPQSIPEAAPLSADTLPFMGTWGVVADGISNPCEPYNTTTYGPDSSDNGHVLIEYENYAEIETGHWQIDAANVYEGSRFPLTIDLYIDGDTMRQVTTVENGRQQEAELVRC